MMVVQFRKNTENIKSGNFYLYEILLPVYRPSTMSCRILNIELIMLNALQV